MDPIRFAVNFDYRCPFARNANEHILAALEGGAPYEVAFKAFSLTQSHVEEGEPDSWDLADKRPEHLALEAGIVVRDRIPDAFRAVHQSLFSLRHDDGEDVRDRSKVAHALERAGVDPALVFVEIEQGWPLKALRAEHEEFVSAYSAFGVPTFVLGDEAVFVRLMTRPAGDRALARRTIDQVLDLLAGHPEINEYKHTTVPF